MSATDHLARLALMVSTAVAIFLCGAAVAHHRVFPYDVLLGAGNAVKDFYRVHFPTHYLFPIRYERAGLRLVDGAAMAPGATLLTSYWKDTNWTAGLRLLDSRGRVLHHWEVRPEQIYPASYRDLVAGARNTPYNYVHGAHLFPNGDVLFNIEYLGLVRMDACGTVKWKMDYRTHHSVHRSDDGSFWVSGLRWVEDPESESAKRFRGLRTPFVEETALRVSPDGAVLEEISLLDVLYGAQLEHLFWRNANVTGDITHLNDVEPLSATMAVAFPAFEPGDLMVSMRNLNAILVLSPATRKVKYVQSTALLSQHDPDFQPDGTITVFDNRTDGTSDGSFLGGSRIVRLDPQSDATANLLPVGSGGRFYTGTGGKHQVLSNGNLLVTEANAGRAIEATPEGRIVWEWIQEPYSAELVPEVLEATRYEIEEGDIAGWSCAPR